MDRSLDEIISERPERQNRGPRRSEPRRGPPSRGPRRDERPRDGVQKFRKNEPVNIDSDWVHDRFEDDRYDRSSRPSDHDHDRRYGRDARDRGAGTSATKIRVENVHYDLTESDLRGLFEQKGPTREVTLLYDRTDRSQGVAFVVYEDPRDARRAVDDFDGCNANGQPIRLTLLPGGPGGRSAGGGASLFDRMDRPEKSLFDRITDSNDDERDRRWQARSTSPRRGGRGGGGSDAGPDRVDRYVPGGRSSRSPIGRRGTPRGGRREQGRRPGARREQSGRGGGGRRGDDNGRSTTAGRPRKTAQELDAEMDDYFNKTAEDSATTQNNGTSATGNVADAGDDIDMVT